MLISMHREYVIINQFVITCTQLITSVHDNVLVCNRVVHVILLTHDYSLILTPL